MSKVCPLIQAECIGKKCAMSVMLDHPNVSAYNVVWKCGLLHDPDIDRHGYAPIVESMSNREWEEYRRKLWEQQAREEHDEEEQ